MFCILLIKDVLSVIESANLRQRQNLKILRAVETSRIKLVRDIADRFGGWQQLIANDIPLLTAVPLARGP